MKTIGKNVRNWRIHDIKKTQLELSKELEIGQTMVSNAEGGGASAIEKVLFKIERVYGKTPEYFGYNAALSVEEKDAQYGGQKDDSHKALVELQRKLIVALEEKSNLMAENARLREKLARIEAQVAAQEKNAES